MAQHPVHDESIAWREEPIPDQAAVDTDVRRTPDGGLAVTARSVCATCQGSTVRRVRRVIPGGHKGPQVRPDAPPLPAELTTITFICDCGYQHPDRPTGERGCSRYWRVTLT
jgi:hypothetical protein